MAASFGSTRSSRLPEKTDNGSADSVLASADGSGRLLPAICEIGFFSLFINALMLVLPIYMLQVYDRVLPSSSRETLIFLSVMAITGLALMACLDVVRSIYAVRFANRLDISNTQTAFQSVIASPRAPLGDIQALRDLSAVRGFLSSRAAFALFDLPYVPLFILLLWFVHPVLFALTATGALLLAGLALTNQLVAAKRIQRSTDGDLTALAAVQSFVRNAETVRSMGMIKNAMEAFGQKHVVSLAHADRVSQLNAVFSGVSRFLRVSLQIAILGLGAHLVLRGEMTAGMIFASSIISARALQPVDQLIGGWRQYADAYNAWRRFRQATSKIPTSQHMVELPEPSGCLRLENVSYAPDPTKGAAAAVLKRITFDVAEGGSVAVIGASGAGKSTLARLIVGAMAPTMGSVRLDGADLAHWPSDTLGRHLGYLPQDLELLPGTVAQNIARFCPDASDASIVEAAQRAQVHALIQNLPDGYNTVIGPGSRLLSGGHRQRIGLARAFFGNPCLLVLDEPNAHLDDSGDEALARALDEARRSGTTVLIVTQRKSIVRQVEYLLVLKDGCIDDFGPRDQVLSRQAQRSLPDGVAVPLRQIKPGERSHQRSVRQDLRASTSGVTTQTATTRGAVAAPGKV